ncbi:MAG: hypothetical protein ABI462_09015, partial [Ignavibacteria bacterium]
MIKNINYIFEVPGRYQIVCEKTKEHRSPALVPAAKDEVQRERQIESAVRKMKAEAFEFGITESGSSQFV